MFSSTVTLRRIRGLFHTESSNCCISCNRADFISPLSGTYRNCMFVSSRSSFDSRSMTLIVSTPSTVSLHMIQPKSCARLFRKAQSDWLTCRRTFLRVNVVLATFLGRARVPNFMPSDSTIPCMSSVMVIELFPAKQGRAPEPVSGYV